MQTLNNGGAKSSKGTADVCVVQNKAKITPYRKILPMTQTESAQNDQSRPGVAKVLSTLMIPQSMSHTNERVTVPNGVGNGAYRFISTKSPENKILHHISNSVLQTLRGNTSINSGNIRVISASPIGINGSPADKGFKSPASIPKEIITKRMKITTVAKRVPLINTVGNQSKLTPLTAPPPASSESPASSKSEAITKPMSILEARLTSTSTSLPVSAANIPAKAGRDKEIASSDVLSSDTSCDDPASNVAEPLRTLKGDGELKNGEPVGLKSSEAVRIPALNLSYEKVVTRLVAVEARTVTMVDVSTQVTQPGEQGVGIKKTLLQSPHAEPMEISGCSQPPAMKSVIPASQKPFVVVDTTGKKVLAIPQQILNSYTGPKTFIIEGKSLKRKSDFTEEPISKRPKTPPKETSASQTGTSANVRNENASNSSLLCRLSTSSSNCLTVTSPVSSERLATPNNSPSSTQQSLALKRLSETSVVCVSPSSKASPNHLLRNDLDGSNSLVLPLDLPVETDSTSLTESSPVQDPSNPSSMFVLVPNETDQELNHESGLIPGVMELVRKQVVTMDKSLNNLAPSRVPVGSKKWVQLSDAINHMLEPTPGVVTTGSSLISPSTRVSNGQIMVPTSISVGRPALEGLSSVVSANHGGLQTEQHLGSSRNSPDGASRKETSKEDVDKLVKSAFSEFKNCLVLNQGNLPIHDAVESNNYTAVKRQCIMLRSRRVSVDVPNTKDETPLQLALFYGHSTLVPLLLQLGADPTVLDRDGNSTLHLAVMHAEDSLKDLLKSGRFSKSSINGLNDEGFSALHLAAQSNKMSCIRFLVRYGADIDQTDGKSGRTALFHAVERKHQDTQALLVSLGADSREATYTGCTPNHVTRADAMAQFSASIQDELMVEQIKSPLLNFPTQSKSHLEVK